MEYAWLSVPTSILSITKPQIRAHHAPKDVDYAAQWQNVLIVIQITSSISMGNFALESMPHSKHTAMKVDIIEIVLMESASNVFLYVKVVQVLINVTDVDLVYS